MSQRVQTSWFQRVGEVWVGCQDVGSKADIGQLIMQSLVSAWQASDSIVTCICFGQEALHKAYVLFAFASKDGAVVIYRCYRTKMEAQLLTAEDFAEDIDTSFAAPPADGAALWQD